MNTNKVFYSITIGDRIFGEFTGDFIAASLDEAILEAKEFYSFEMDTQPEEIEILKVSIK
jgi:hypothetical protein